MSETVVGTEIKEAPEQPSLRDSFLNALPEERRGTFEKYRDDKSLVDGILSAQEMIGRRGDIPGEDAGPEKFTEFWGKLGAGKIEPGKYEYGEEFGDLAKPLSDAHAGVDAKVTEIFNETLKSAKSLPEIKDRVVRSYLKAEAEAQKVEAAQARQQAEERGHKLAVEFGLSQEALNGTLKGVFSRLGLKEDMDLSEALTRLAYQYAKDTTETTTLESARLNNTSAGLKQQFEDIVRSEEYLNPYHPDNAKAVEKLKRLQARADSLK